MNNKGEYEMKKHIKQISLYIIASTFVLFLVIWGTALLKCEILTHKYYNEFEFTYQNNTMLTDVKYFKVLSCDEKSAEVYYISDSTGDILEFKNQGGIWVENEWNTIWSKNGSASNIVWPYLWHIFITVL